MKNADLSDIASFKVATYGAGDSLGKSALAKQDAIEQGALQIPGSVRAKIYAIQAGCADYPEVEFPLNHTFAPGVYIRTIKIPAGSLVVGKIHKHKHGNILSQGKVSVFTENGGMETLVAPLTLVSDSGTKRALYAHTDLVWSTIHLSNSTDLAVIEQELIAKDYAEYESFLLTEGENMKKLEVSLWLG